VRHLIDYQLNIDTEGVDGDEWGVPRAIVLSEKFLTDTPLGKSSLTALHIYI